MAKLIFNTNAKGHILGALVTDDEGNEWGLNGVDMVAFLMGDYENCSYEFSMHDLDPAFERDDLIGIDRVVFNQVD